MLQNNSLIFCQDTNVSIRSAIEADAVKLLELKKAVIRSGSFLLFEEPEFKQTLEELKRFISERTRSASSLCFLAETDNEVIGCLDLYASDLMRISHYANLSVMIAESFRGRGVGKALIVTAIDWARHHSGLESLRLRVHGSNTSAIALYRKLGFHEEGREIRGARLRDGHFDDVVMMALHLRL